MVDKDSTQSTWERPSSGRDYAFFEFVKKLEMDLHNAMRSDLGYGDEKLYNIPDKDSE